MTAVLICKHEFMLNMWVIILGILVLKILTNHHLQNKSRKVNLCPFFFKYVILFNFDKKKNPTKIVNKI